MRHGSRTLAWTMVARDPARACLGWRVPTRWFTERVERRVALWEAEVETLLSDSDLRGPTEWATAFTAASAALD